MEYPHESMAISAAIGAVQRTGQPGVVIVPLTAGTAHRLGKLFAAARSRTPLVVLGCQPNERVRQCKLPLKVSQSKIEVRQFDETRWRLEI